MTARVSSITSQHTNLIYEEPYYVTIIKYMVINIKYFNCAFISALSSRHANHTNLMPYFT